MSLTSLAPSPAARRRACTDHAALFSDEILSYTPHDADYEHLTAHEHAEHAERRRTFEAAAKNICAGCPALALCRKESLETEVYGVAGGMTASERRNANPDLPDTADENLDDRDRLWRGRVNDDAVERLTRAQWTNQQIADHLDCTPRTVARARARLRSGKPMPRITGARTPAKSAAPTSRATSAMQAIYDRLADGRWHDREDLLSLAIPRISDEDALTWYARRHPEDHTTARSHRIAVGARAVADNRLSASARTRGRTMYDKQARRYRIAAPSAVRTAA